MSRGGDLEVTISSAKNIKNVNWRNGPNKPYAVVWIDPRNKSSTRVDEEGDTSPSWNETLFIPLFPNEDHDEQKLSIDIVHAGREEDTKPLIGSATLKLKDVLEEAGYGVPYVKKLKLKRPSGRPQGKLEVTVTIRDPRYHQGSKTYESEAYGVPQGGYGYGPPQHSYGSAYGEPPSGYGGPPGGGYYAQSGYEEHKKESKFGGMGTGLAIGAVAGVVGGVALAEGYEALEENIEEEEAAEEGDYGEEE